MKAERWIVRKVWELAKLCSEQDELDRNVNMVEFRNALDSWEITWKEATAALRELEDGIYLLRMRDEEEREITGILIIPPTYRCPDCRLMVSSRQNWEDHLPACRRQQAKMRKLGMLP